MQYIALIVTFCLLSLSASADERIYEVNKYGQTQYDKDSYVKKDDRIYQVNKYGQTQYGEKSYVIKSDKLYEVNKYGQTQYDKPQASQK